MTEPELATTRQPRSPRPAHRRAILRVTSDQIAGLLRLPDDVTVAAFALDPLRDSIAFALSSERFDPVAPGAEPPALESERAVDMDDDGTVTLRVAWPDLGGAGFSIRHEAPRRSAGEEES